MHNRANGKRSVEPKTIALLGPAHSIHTIRWANGLARRGLQVHLISLTRQDEAYDPAVTVHRLPGGAPYGYVLAARALRALLRRLRPDVLNAHYATGYGLLARLGAFSPTLLSAWGSDIYSFPDKSRLHAYVLRRNLDSATAVAVTGHAMLVQAQRYTRKPIFITPFGVDTALFAPKPGSAHRDEPIVIGTVKALETTYGIDTLLQAFGCLRSGLAAAQPGIARRLRLRIYGSGTQAGALLALARQLGIGDCTEFNGHIPHDQVPAALHGLDIYVALSRMDSFGVAILEASACGLPVVVSDADGPAEVVQHGATGYVVPREDADAAAAKLRELVLDPAQRLRMGTAGRERVLGLYSWQSSLDSMLDAYSRTLGQSQMTEASRP
ncbi:MAG: glycosyltransferase [Achromobacter sp.]